MKLTQNEALYIADIISIHVEPPPEPLRISPYPEMMFKIMEVVVAHDGAELDEVETNFLPNELMLIYEHAKSSVVIGTERVGYNLLIKASKGILALKDGKTALDERIWEFEVNSNDDAESNTSDPEDRAADSTDQTIPA